MNCFFRWFFQCLGAELISLITICQLCHSACATSALTASSPCKPSVHSPEKGEMPRQRLPWCQWEADPERGFGAASRGVSRSEEEGAVWWSSGGTKVPGSNFSHLPPVAVVPVQVPLLPCWLTFQWLSSGSTVLCPGCAPGFGLTGTGSLLHLWLSPSSGTSVSLLWLVWGALDVLAFETNRFWV